MYRKLHDSADNELGVKLLGRKADEPDEDLMPVMIRAAPTWYTHFLEQKRKSLDAGAAKKAAEGKKDGEGDDEGSVWTSWPMICLYVCLGITPLCLCAYCFFLSSQGGGTAAKKGKKDKKKKNKKQEEESSSSSSSDDDSDDGIRRVLK